MSGSLESKGYCTNNSRTCKRHDCPLREWPNSNCFSWMARHLDELEEPERERPARQTLS